MERSELPMGAATEEPQIALAQDLELGKPKKPKLSMAFLNMLLDGALLLAILVVMWVSMMLQVVFPTPTSADGWELWGLTYDQWHNVQIMALGILALLAIEHLVLHWTWVCSIIATKVFRAKKRPDEGTQVVYGVGTFIVTMLFMLASLITAVFMVKSPGE